MVGLSMGVTPVNGSSSSRPSVAASAQTVVETAFRRGRRLALLVFFTSLFINLLMLVPSLYMLQVYDRVLVSRSEPTLVLITLVSVFLLAMMAGLDLLRSLIMARLANRFDSEVREPVLAGVLADVGGLGGTAVPSLAAELERIRGFLAGSHGHAFFDLPWMPLYLVILYLLHPLQGHLALAGAVVIGALGWVGERWSRRATAASSRLMSRGGALAQTILDNADQVATLGLRSNWVARWAALRNQALREQTLASDRLVLVGAVSKFVRLSLQVAMLGLGAVLVLRYEISAGMIIAGSIIMGRALAPIEQTAAAWRAFVPARESFLRLRRLAAAAGVVAVTPLEATPPAGVALVAENLVVGAPGGRRPLIKGVSLALAPGEVLGILGINGSGKSTLARALLGLWSAAAGVVRINGQPLAAHGRETWAGRMGYLPQEPGVFTGSSVAENIDPLGQGGMPAVVEAARQVGLHEVILTLPRGYETPVGGEDEGAWVPAGGHRRRLALARAVRGYPPLVVLDEPENGLDLEGESLAIKLVRSLKERGVTVVLITHRPAFIALTDRCLVLRDGAVEVSDTTARVMEQLKARRTA
ncbi:MAG: ATP-binding cassette domain-containing protein [Magnetococcus sp. WYHC-3]